MFRKNGLSAACVLNVPFRSFSLILLLMVLLVNIRASVSNGPREAIIASWMGANRALSRSASVTLVELVEAPMMPESEMRCG